jgi:hypothetical protein
MAFEIATGEQRWQAARHPLLGFFRHTRHPDIDIAPRTRTPARRVAYSPRPAVSSVASERFALI